MQLCSKHACWVQEMGAELQANIRRNEVLSQRFAVLEAALGVRQTLDSTVRPCHLTCFSRLIGQVASGFATKAVKACTQAGLKASWRRARSPSPQRMLRLS